MMGKVFDIQRFCTGDGPGIRTTVFLKGCPLKCAWCHNPESQKMESEIMFWKEKCTGCGRCRDISFKDVDFVCWQDAKKVCGRDMSVEDVMEEVMKDAPYYKNSGGGMTLSGGEPLIQPEFAIEILRAAKGNGLHTAVETCGFAKSGDLKRIAAYTDLFLFDYKETDPEKHRKFTGADSGIILENLGILDAMGKAIVLRCPVIPGFNDREDHYAGICAVANRHENIIRVEIEPCHDLGMHKYAALGRQAHPIAAMERKQAEEVAKRIRQDTEIPVRLA